MGSGNGIAEACGASATMGADVTGGLTGAVVDAMELDDRLMETCGGAICGSWLSVTGSEVAGRLNNGIVNSELDGKIPRIFKISFAACRAVGCALG